MVMNILLRNAKRYTSLCLILSLFLFQTYFFMVRSYSDLGLTEYRDRAIGSLGVDDKITLRALETLTHNILTIGAFKQVIANYLLAYNIRQVMLDIGWQNYSVGEIPYEKWVDNWLTACDALGVENLFYVGQFTPDGIGSPWVESLISRDPTTRTYYSDGQAAPYISPDDPDVALAIETDLSMLYSYYGNHTSWAGIGTGYSADPYYSTSSTMPLLGYSNLTLANFANSIYFNRDINNTGFDQGGTPDELWNMFRNVSQAVQLSSGNWMLSSPDQLYGTEYSVLMNFYIPVTVRGLEIQWYGQKVGNPGDLFVEIYSNGVLVANGSETSTSISNSTEWQNPIRFTGTFVEGNYQVAFSGSSENPANYYEIFMRDYGVLNARALYVLPPGQGSMGGSTILWVKDLNGSTISLYPYQQALVNPPSTQTFIATNTFSFNTVFLFVSDREFDPVNGTLEVMDLSDNQTIAQAVLSQSLTHGLQDWVPFILNQSVTAVKGHKYMLEVTEPYSGYSWRVILRGLTVDPAQAGFQNQSQYLLFRLASMNIASSHLDFLGETSNGGSAVTAGRLDAVRFSPSWDETIQSVSIQMKNLNPTGDYYSPNSSMTVGIWSSDPNGSAPQAPILQNITVDGSSIPQNGMLSVSGFNQQLQKGKFYWIVFSTDSYETFPFGRLTSPYRYLVQVSTNGGQTWSNAADGPTEFSFKVSLSNETLGNLINGYTSVTLNETSVFAQPFSVFEATQAIGAYFPFFLTRQLQANNHLIVSINLDNGEGAPSLETLASGVYYGSNVTYAGSPDFIQFSSVARLQPGQKYWLVIRAEGGIYFVAPAVYSMRPSDVPSGFTDLVSNDNGMSWNTLSNETTYLPYEVMSSVYSLPSYSSSQLYDDLIEYHDFSTNTGLLHGWNAYIQASELNNYQSIISWFENFTGKAWTFETQASQNLLNQLDDPDVISLSSLPPITNCSSLMDYFLTSIPKDNLQYYPINNETLLKECGSSGTRNFSQQLNYMHNSQSLGKTSNLSLLVVGDNPYDENLANELGNIFNVTFAYPDSDHIAFSSLHNYKTILWLSNLSSSSLGIQPVLQSYVESGGELVGTEQASSWIQSMIGINPNLSTQFVRSDTSTLADLYNTMTAHTSYYGKLVIQSISANFSSANSSQIGLSVFEYGSGRVVIINSTNALLNIPQLSDDFLVLANTISSSDSLRSSPVWYEGNAANYSSLVYSLSGGAGSPILFWVSNPSYEPVAVNFDINGSSYSIPNNWGVLDLSTLTWTEGVGSTITVNSTVAPRSWEEIYIVHTTSNLIEYTNGNVGSQSVYPNQALYSIQAVQNQSIIVAISYGGDVGKVLQNDNLSLSKAATIQQLQSESDGWYYDAVTQMLYVKYLASGNDAIEVFQPQSIAPANSGFRLLIVLSGIIISLDVTLFTYLWFRKQRKHMMRYGH
jgi:hypothetical protein